MDHRTRSSLRRGLLAAGAVALAAVLLRGEHHDAPRTDPLVGADAALAARVARYADLRRADDWTALYDMVDPAERARCDLTRFLTHYGHGVLRVHALEPVATEIDAAARRAAVRFEIDAELDVRRLPPEYRKGLRGVRDEDRRQRGPLAMEWVWRDGDWYWRIERALLTGRDASGREVVPPDGG